MNREEIEKKAKDALAAAGDMASRGAEWLRHYRESHRTPTDEPVQDGRKIMFDLKRGDFSGPPLPEAVLNEMVAALKQRVCTMRYPVSTLSRLRDGGRLGIMLAFRGMVVPVPEKSNNRGMK